MSLAEERCIYTKRNASVTSRAYRPESRVPTACTLLHSWQLVAIVGQQTWFTHVFSLLHLRRIIDGSRRHYRRRCHWHADTGVHHRTVGQLSATEVASILNFIMLVKCSLLIVYEYVDFISGFFVAFG